MFTVCKPDNRLLVRPRYAPAAFERDMENVEQIQQKPPQEGSPMNPAAYPDLRAPGPSPDLEAMRDAYLELLALALCDLTGSGTLSVHRRLGSGVYARELMVDETETRIRGRDWPLHGLSMAGLLRLRDVRRCIEAAIEEGVEGDLVETGCWRGGASMMMRATLDSLARRTAPSGSPTRSRGSRSLTGSSTPRTGSSTI